MLTSSQVCRGRLGDHGGGVPSHKVAEYRRRGQQDGRLNRENRGKNGNVLNVQGKIALLGNVDVVDGVGSRSVRRFGFGDGRRGERNALGLSVASRSQGEHHARSLGRASADNDGGVL